MSCHLWSYHLVIRATASCIFWPFFLSPLVSARPFSSENCNIFFFFSQCKLQRWICGENASRSTVSEIVRLDTNNHARFKITEIYFLPYFVAQFELQQVICMPKQMVVLPCYWLTVHVLNEQLNIYYIPLRLVASQCSLAFCCCVVLLSCQHDKVYSTFFHLKYGPCSVII